MAPMSSKQPVDDSLGMQRLGRRRFLSLGVAGTAGTLVAAALGGCSQETQANSEGQRPTEGNPTTSMQTSDAPADPAAPKVLVAYFSRAGENYYYGDRTWLEVGNTEVVAGDHCGASPVRPTPDRGG
jgi:hypothetical protein